MDVEQEAMRTAALIYWHWSEVGLTRMWAKELKARIQAEFPTWSGGKKNFARDVKAHVMKNKNFADFAAHLEAWRRGTARTAATEGGGGEAGGGKRPAPPAAPLSPDRRHIEKRQHIAKCVTRINALSFFRLAPSPPPPLACLYYG
jgi:hypothetical protein